MRDNPDAYRVGSGRYAAVRTSARSSLADGIEDAVRGIRQYGDIPVCVGFGISSPEHARQVGQYADGVVVGSAIVDRIESAESKVERVDAVARFIEELKAPLREPVKTR